MAGLNPLQPRDRHDAGIVESILRSPQLHGDKTTAAVHSTKKGGQDTSEDWQVHRIWLQLYPIPASAAAGRGGGGGSLDAVAYHRMAASRGAAGTQTFM